MHQNITESSQGRQFERKINRQDTHLTHDQERLIVIAWFTCVTQRNKAVADVNTSLGSNFQVTLYDIAQIGIL